MQFERKIIDNWILQLDDFTLLRLKVFRNFTLNNDDKHNLLRKICDALSNAHRKIYSYVLDELWSYFVDDF